jgi:hypothetical protein
MIFWANPIRNGIRHKFDTIFAKTTVVIATLFVLFYQKNEFIDKITYLISFFMMHAIFTLSSSCSRLKWCSLNHIITHVFFHIIIVITLFEHHVLHGQHLFLHAPSLKNRL